MKGTHRVCREETSGSEGAYSTASFKCVDGMDIICIHEGSPDETSHELRENVYL
jgi:hypothetical protein